MDADTQELGGSLQRGSVDTAAGHDGGSSGGDALGGPRDVGPPQTSPASSSSSENCPNSGNSSGTQRSHRISLGWQSLLPGSIQ
jgi:hypothetical protein